MFSSIGTGFASPLLGERILQMGFKGKDVSELQKRLKQLGYFTHPRITEYFGPITQAAVKGFQKNQKLQVDGIAGQQTVKKLIELTAPKVIPVSRGGSANPFYYTVLAGDSLWIISNKFKTTPDQISKANNLKSDLIYVGQRLMIPSGNAFTNPQVPSSPIKLANREWPSVTYIVKAGDTVNDISRKFGVSASDLLRYNYDGQGGYFNEGEKIAINGYAPRDYTVSPGEASAPAKVGKTVDWFYEGKYILKRDNIFTIVDVGTGNQFVVKMLGGTNHSDIEPLTLQDTNLMKNLYGGSWTWTPRPVVIFKDGMNIAASLSGMPHSIDSTPNNGVNGHFDLYLLNSSPHSSASENYLKQHANNVFKAAGKSL